MSAGKCNQHSQSKPMEVKKQKIIGKKQCATAIKKGSTRQEIETQEKLKRLIVQLRRLTNEEIQRATHK